MADARQLDRIKQKSVLVWPALVPHVQAWSGIAVVSHGTAWGDEMIKVAHPRSLEAIEAALDALLKGGV